MSPIGPFHDSLVLVLTPTMRGLSKGQDCLILSNTGEAMKISGGELEQIGVVHSPYKGTKEAPHQGRSKEISCTLEVYEEYEAALQDIERCSHLFVLYWQHQADRSLLRSKTPWGPEVRGVFATRSPNRPNPIGLCIVDLIERNGRFLKVTGMDAIDGSPLIDLKPYSPSLDALGEPIDRRARRA